jgi:hypothetical protein
LVTLIESRTLPAEEILLTMAHTMVCSKKKEYIDKDKDITRSAILDLLF